LDRGATPHVPTRRSSDLELQQREHLALRFGLVLRRDAGELARRERTGRATAAALAVPYYALIHHGSVVPRQALAQRGRLDGVVADRKSTRLNSSHVKISY